MNQIKENRNLILAKDIKIKDNIIDMDFYKNTFEPISIQIPSNDIKQIEESIAVLD